MSKEECCIWADEVVTGLDPLSRSMLKDLARKADDDDRAWMTVAKLVQLNGVSERTIQSRLRKLEGADDGPVFIRKTGDSYRMGTRDVPYYELQVDYDAVAALQESRKARQKERRAERSMGANSCTHAPSPMGANSCTHSETSCTPMGASCCTQGEPDESQGSLTLTQRARHARDLAEEILSAMPPEFLGRTSAREIAAAVRAEVAKGSAAGDITAGVLAYLGNRKAWGASGEPMAPHKLIASGRWETSLRAVTPKGSPGPRTGFAPDDPARVEFVARWGEASARSWFDPCGRGPDGLLLARTDQARDWLHKRGYRVERQSAAGKVG
jgi:hypothetical protein